MSRIPHKRLDQHMLARQADTTDKEALPLRAEDGDLRATLFASIICVLGTLMLLGVLLGWWVLLAAPAYLVAIGVLSIMLSRGSLSGQLRPLLAVALATASMSVVVGVLKLTGLA